MEFKLKMMTFVYGLIYIFKDEEVYTRNDETYTENHGFCSARRRRKRYECVQNRRSFIFIFINVNHENDGLFIEKYFLLKSLM